MYKVATVILTHSAVLMHMAIDESYVGILTEHVMSLIGRLYQCCQHGKAGGRICQLMLSREHYVTRV